MVGRHRTWPEVNHGEEYRAETTGKTRSHHDDVETFPTVLSSLGDHKGERQIQQLAHPWNIGPLIEDIVIVAFNYIKDAAIEP